MAVVDRRQRHLDAGREHFAQGRCAGVPPHHPALRLAADSQRRDPGRQRRPRLADRRFAAVSVRHGSGAGAGRAARQPPREDQRVLQGLQGQGPGRPTRSSRAFVLPLPAADELLKLYKVSRRNDLDIATFGAAIRVRRAGESITRAYVAYSGVGADGGAPAGARRRSCKASCLTEETFRRPASVRTNGDSADLRRARLARLSAASGGEHPAEVLLRLPGTELQAIGVGRGNSPCPCSENRCRTIRPASMSPARRSTSTICRRCATSCWSTSSAVPLAHGRIKSIDVARPPACDGIVGVFTHADVPGENTFGPIFHDEELLADGRVPLHRPAHRGPGRHQPAGPPERPAPPCASRWKSCPPS